MYGYGYTADYDYYGALLIFLVFRVEKLIGCPRN